MRGLWGRRPSFARKKFGSAVLAKIVLGDEDEKNKIRNNRWLRGNELMKSFRLYIQCIYLGF